MSDTVKCRQTHSDLIKLICSLLIRSHGGMSAGNISVEADCSAVGGHQRTSDFGLIKSTEKNSNVIPLRLFIYVFYHLLILQGRCISFIFVTSAMKTRRKRDSTSSYISATFHLNRKTSNIKAACIVFPL